MLTTTGTLVLFPATADRISTRSAGAEDRRPEIGLMLLEDICCELRERARIQELKKSRIRGASSRLLRVASRALVGLSLGACMFLSLAELGPRL
jgi:hypothetical protein